MAGGKFRANKSGHTNPGNNGGSASGKKTDRLRDVMRGIGQSELRGSAHCNKEGRVIVNLAVNENCLGYLKHPSKRPGSERQGEWIQVPGS